MVISQAQVRHAAAGFWLVLLCGCSGRVPIGRDELDASATDTGSGHGGTGGAGGATGGTGGATGGTGGATSGTGGATGGTGGVITGTGGTTGGSGGATGGQGGSSGSGGIGGFAGSGATGGAGGGAGTYPPFDAGPLPPWPDANACLAGNGSPLVGTWIGYIESFNFPSGSDAVRLTVRGADSATLCGTITFGKGDPPPPAADPNVGYPPGYSADWIDGWPYAPIEGFPYELQTPLVAGKRVKFQTATYDPWHHWCELQTSYQKSQFSYGCLPSWQSANTGPPSEGPDTGPKCALKNPDTLEIVPIDCVKYRLCAVDFGSSACVCNSSGCSVDPNASTFNLDAQFDAGDAKGTIKIVTQQQGEMSHAVYLTKSE